MIRVSEGLNGYNQEATFHVDHVVPKVAGGKTTIDNLALACVSCSLRKGPRTNAVDPATAETSEIFHPRLHAWTEHFAIDPASCEITGRTSIGRATVVLLRLNRPLAVAIRREEMLRERWP